MRGNIFAAENNPIRRDKRFLNAQRKEEEDKTLTAKRIERLDIDIKQAENALALQEGKVIDRRLSVLAYQAAVANAKAKQQPMGCPCRKPYTVGE